MKAMHDVVCRWGYWVVKPHSSRLWRSYHATTQLNKVPQPEEKEVNIMKLLIRKSKCPCTSVQTFHPIWRIFISRNANSVMKAQTRKQTKQYSSYILSQNKFQIWQSWSQRDKQEAYKFLIHLPIESSRDLADAFYHSFNCDLPAFPMVAFYSRGDRIQNRAMFHWLTAISFPSTSQSHKSLVFVPTENAGLFQRRHCLSGSLPLKSSFLSLSGLCASY